MRNEEENASIKLIQSSVDAYKTEHDELWQNWRHLDNKAQANITVSGIFIAAVFAFINSISTSFCFVEKIIIVAALLLISSSIIISLIALFVKRVKSAPLGQDYYNLISDLLDTDDFSSIKRQVNLLKDQIKLWDKVNDELQQVNHYKAKKVMCSQIILLIAILFIVVLTIIVIV